MGMKIFAAAMLTLVLPFPAFGQALIPDSPFQEPPAPPQGTVNCFDYYKFGSVAINDLRVSAPNPVSGIPLGIKGTIRNNNPYPITEGAVYIKVFRNDEHFSRSQSYGIVDQFVAEDNITLPANGSAELNAAWNIPSYLATGDYRIASFFVAQNRYNLLGLTFTDDIVGNVVDFRVVGERVSMVRIDKDAVTINGKPHNFVGPYPSFGKDETVIVSVPIINETNGQASVSVSWTLSEWDGMRKDAVLNEKTENVSLKPKEQKIVSYTAANTGYPVYYLTVRTKTGDASSVANIRFVREGTILPRINFPSVMGYPLKAGQEATVFSCLHATGDETVKNGTLELALSDEKGNILHFYRYEGDITSAMMGVKDVFVPKKDYYDFNLNAKIYKDGVLVDETTTRYGCTMLNPDNPELCARKDGEKKTPALPFLSTSAFLSAAIAVISLIILALLGFVMKRRFTRSGDAESGDNHPNTP